MIIILLPISVVRSRRTYINFKKTDRERYAEAYDEYLAEACEIRTVEQADRTFKKAANKTRGLFIPANRIRHFQPTLQASAKSIAVERDRMRRLCHADETFSDLNKRIQKQVLVDTRTKWQSAVDKCDHRTGIRMVVASWPRNFILVKNDVVS